MVFIGLEGLLKPSIKVRRVNIPDDVAMTSATLNGSAQASTFDIEQELRILLQRRFIYSETEKDRYSLIYGLKRFTDLLQHLRQFLRS